MRSAFIEPEKHLIENIDTALSKLDTYKYLLAKYPKEKEGMRAILLNTSAEFEKVKEKYKNLQSPAYTAELTQLWNSITESTIAFSQDVNDMRTIIDHFANQIDSGDTREEAISEFIANISANRDGGASQRAALIAVCANVAINAHTAITALVPNDLIGDRESVTAWLRENRALTRPHVQQALKQEVAHLTDVGDETIQRMWQNQEAAVNDCLAQLIMLDRKTVTIHALADSIATAWENYERLFKLLPKRIPTDRQTELLTIASKATDELHTLQKKIKFPPNDFGLHALMREIQLGQKEMFETYKKTQRQFRKVMEDSNALANASPLASPISSTRSTQSRSSFFSSATSRGSSYSSSSFSNNDLSDSESDVDEPIRQKARMQ